MREIDGGQLRFRNGKKTPTPGVFGQRVCNQLKTKEMIFDRCKRVRKNIKTKGIGIWRG
jgi:hypothetical protein